MTTLKNFVLFMALSLQGVAASAADTTLSAAYLQGKWSEGGQEGCSAARSGYVIFHNNRTLVAGIGEAVSAVGFWELGDDTVTLHLLVSPAAGGTGGHPFYQNRYYYQYLSPHILGLRPDSFQYSQDTGAQAGATKTLTRCQ